MKSFIYIKKGSLTDQLNLLNQNKNCQNRLEKKSFKAKDLQNKNKLSMRIKLSYNLNV